MDRRSGAAILAVLSAIVIGYLAFEAGLQHGVLAAGQGAAAAPYAYGYHYGPGFGFFGLLFPLLFIFLIFGLLRAAFGCEPHSGGHGGYWRGGPRATFEEWHREAHTDRPPDGSGDATTS